jgi:hypothetical protein
MNYKSFFFALLTLCAAACNLERIDDNQGGLGGNTCPDAKFSTQIGGTNYDYPVDVLATDDCSFVVCGGTYTVNNNIQAYLVKTDDKGVQQWERTYGTPSYDLIRKVTPIKTGGYMICGATSDFNPGTFYDAYLIKTDQNGIEAWQRHYEIPGFSVIASGITQLADGGFLLACSKYDTSISPIADQIAMIKIDANGGEDWTKLISNTSKNLQVADMKPTADGGFIIAGSANDVVTSITQTYILKLDASGNKVWEKYYSNPNSTYSPGYAVAALANGYAVSASILGPNDHDFNVLFYDLNGTLKWEKTFGGVSADEAIDITATSDGQVAVIGYSSSFSASVEVYLLQLSSTDGTTIWEKHFGNGSGISTYVAAAKDGGFIVSGTNSTTNNTDILLYKTDKNGNFQ